MISRFCRQSPRYFSSVKKLRLAIVGSGPSGFYLTGLIKRQFPEFTIDIFEKELLPFGLIRYGVAPDHQDVKKIIRNQTEIGQIDGVRFFGGVEIGNLLSIEQLESYYSAVIYAYGAPYENFQNIKGDIEAQNVLPSNSFINYYNGHPSHQKFPIKNWQNVKTISIIGNGNVALDVSRLLAITKNELIQSDVNLDYLEQINKRNLKNIVVYGRRGLVQSSFSLKELREMTKLENAKLWLVEEDVERSMTEASIIESTATTKLAHFQTARALKRKLDLFKNSFEVIKEKDLQSLLDGVGGEKDKINLIFRFLFKPKEILTDDKNFVKEIKFSRTKLQGEPYKQSAVIDETFEDISYQTDVIFRAIGFHTYSIDPKNVPFDEKSGVISNSNGCVQTEPGSQNCEIGKYCTGWAKTGAVGIIDSTLRGVEETWVNMLRHLQKDFLVDKPDPYTAILDQVKDSRISFDDWLKINQYEIDQGKKHNLCRVKVNCNTEIRNLLF